MGGVCCGLVALGSIGHQKAVTAISNLVAAHFWHNLHEFAASHQAELPNQFPDIPTHHPFLAIQGGVLHAQLPLEFNQ